MITPKLSSTLFKYFQGLKGCIILRSIIQKCLMRTTLRANIGVERELFGGSCWAPKVRGLLLVYQANHFEEILFSYCCLDFTKCFCIWFISIPIMFYADYWSSCCKYSKGPRIRTSRHIYNIVSLHFLHTSHAWTALTESRMSSILDRSREIASVIAKVKSKTDSHTWHNNNSPTPISYYPTLKLVVTQISTTGFGVSSKDFMFRIF